MGPLLRRDTIFIGEIDQGQGQPTGKVNVGAERINLTLGENHGDLNSSQEDVKGFPSTGCGPTNRVTRNWEGSGARSIAMVCIVA